MSVQLPNAVNAKKLAQKQQIISGIVVFNDCARLVSALSEQAGIMRVELSFHLQDQRVILDSHIQGEVILTCQQCLDDFEYNIDTKSQCILIQESELEEIDETLEPFYVDHLSNLNIIDFVTDEVLLHLPQIPKHTQSCPRNLIAEYSMEAPKEEKISPFAKLKALKKGET